MSFMPELGRLTVDQLIERFRSPPPKSERKYAVAYYQEVAIRIREQGKQGIDFLLNEQKHVDEPRLRGILLGLTSPRLDHPAVRAILLSCLYDQRPMVVADAIDGLTRQGEREHRSQILALSLHGSPFVRGSVLRYVADLFPSESVPMLVAAMRDPNFIVRENAIDELDDQKATDALPAIRLLKSDPHPHVRQAAETAIANFEALETLAETFKERCVAFEHLYLQRLVAPLHTVTVSGAAHTASSNCQRQHDLSHPRQHHDVYGPGGGRGMTGWDCNARIIRW